jgi:hypothetical protein
MALMSINLGAELDIATGQELAETSADLKSEMRKGWSAKPIYDSRASAAMSPGVAEWFMDLGSPDVGRIWNVLGVTIFGSDDSTAVGAAKVSLYFGDSDTPSITGLRVPNMACPSFQSFSDKVLWCHSTANVVIGVTGVAAAQQIGALVHIANWRESDISAWTTR